jgi:GNAT superfamily N-acetyltransferase
MRTAIRATQQHFHDLASHFLALGPGDRRWRFGWALTDAQIVAYVESLLASDDTVLVVAEPLRGISGVLHLESMGSGVTLGLSVSARSRGLGIGTLLLQRAKLLARTQGLKTLYLRNLSANSTVQRLALRLGMSVACEQSARGFDLQVPAPERRDAVSARMITLADDSLRPQWNGAPAGAGLPDLIEPVLS